MAADELADEVRNVRFTPVRFREGYDMSEVDDFLDQVVAALESGAPVADLVEHARFTPVRMREGYDMADVDDFLARVVARAGGQEPSGDAAPGVRRVDDAAPRRAPEQSRTPYPEVIKENRSWWSRTFGSRGR